MKRLLNALHAADTRHHFFKKRSGILLALSGGPDSVCLALLLKVLQSKYAFRLAAAHVHHGLRKEATSDMKWVRSFCDQHDLDFYPLKVNVPKRNSLGNLSVEEAARNVRYRELITCAKKNKFHSIATAHSADDQAETVLMRLSIGSGLSGLAGIAIDRVEGGIRIIRPLINSNKEDILRALKNARQKYLKDASNASDRFMRNRVRNEILPKIKRRVNPRITEHLVAVAEDAALWKEWSDTACKEFLSRCTSVLPQKGRKFTLTAYCRLPRVLQAPALMAVACDVSQKNRLLRRSQIRDLQAWLMGPATKQSLHLQSLVITRTRAHVLFCPQ